MSSPTEYKGWKPPGRKSLDDYSDYESSVANFVKNTGLRFLQLVYQQRESNNLKYIHDDEDATEIRISDQHAFQLEATDLKPAIIAVRGSMQWGNVGMNNGLQSLNMRTGQEERTDIISTSVAFSCLSRVGLEAEQIASDVFNLFKFFRKTLSKHGFLTIRSASIGPEQLIEAPGEPKLFLVSVLLTCQVQDRWLLEPKAAAELKRVVVEGLMRSKEPDESDEPDIRIEINNEENE